MIEIEKRDKEQKQLAAHLEDEVPLIEPEICKIEDPHEHIEVPHVGLTDIDMSED